MYQANGKLHSKEQYVVQYAPLVKRIAHYMAAKLPPSVQVDDLIQAGLIGLLDAVGNYDQTQGAQFETYATQRIRGAMLDELREADWAPRSARKSMRVLRFCVMPASALWVVSERENTENGVPLRPAVSRLSW